MRDKFAAQVLGASLLVAIVVWNAAPVAGPAPPADDAEIAAPALDATEMPAERQRQRPERATLLDAAQPEFAVPSEDATERGVYYPNCRAARASGAAPIYRGSPGYREALDRDRDGIACEPYR